MTPPEEHLCAECGRSLPDQSLGQRCPNCLLQLALTPPPEELVAATPVMPKEAGNGERRFFAGYELQGEIARGGMGVVYRARQFQPDRPVALKMIHPAGRATPAARLRFEVEIAAVARLHHPRIVSLYESGEHEGVCFYSMRLVEGDGLDVWLAEKRLPDSRAARVDLLVKVAEAVQYAHDRGILHRDLKPSNVLLGQDGEPCIADFGLAKIQEADAGITQDRSVLGSPSYMAPEQAAGDGGEITTAADVYSLGAILYELLTGRPPFLADNPLETLRRVKEEPPVPPRQLAPTVPRDLESICLKALEKEPSRRYASAQALADDLRRWRRGEQVQARPISTLAQAGRWCRRRPAVAALLIVSLTSLVALAVGSTVAARRLQVAGDETRQLVRRLQHQNAEGYLERGETAKGLAVLAHLVRTRPDDPVAGTRLLSAMSQRTLAVPLVPPWGSGAEVLAVGFTRDGRHSAGVARNGRFRGLELATGRTWDALLAKPGDAVVAAAFHEHGDFLATAHADGPLRLWRTLSPETPFAELPHPSPLKHLALDRASHAIATVDQANVVRWWRTSATHSGREAAEDGPSGWYSRELPLPAGESVNAAAFSPDGRWFGIAAESGTLFVWKVTDDPGEPRHLQMPGRVQMLTFDPASRRVAAASGWNTVLIWTLEEPAAAPLKLVLEATCTQLEFSPDGRFLAAAGWSAYNQAVVWDTVSGKRIAASLSHQGNVTSLKFSPDGRELLTQGHDHRGRRWDTRTWELLGEPLVHVTAPLKLAYDATGRRLITGSYSGVAWWDLSPPAGAPVVLAHDSRVMRGAFSPDGKSLATGTSAGRVRLWNAHDHSQRAEFPAQPDAVLYVGFNHAGDQFVTFGLEGIARFWNTATGEPQGQPLAHPAPIYSAVFSRDDRELLTAGTDGLARRWELATGKEILPALRHGAPLMGAVFDPAGARIVTFGQTNELRMWEAATGQPVEMPLTTGGVIVEHAEFSPDGRWLVATGREPRVHLWEAATGRPAAARVQHQNGVLMAAFSPDSAWLATASVDATVQIVRLDGSAQRVLIPHAASVTHVSFSPDGRWLLTASQAGESRVWDPATGLPVTEPLRGVPSPGTRAGFSPGRLEILTLSGTNSVSLWMLPEYRGPAGSSLAALAETVGRMAMNDDGHFVVSPAGGWEELPPVLDLPQLLRSVSRAGFPNP